MMKALRQLGGFQSKYNFTTVNALPPLTTEDQVPAELFLVGGVTGASPGALWEIKSTPKGTPVVRQGGTL